MQTIQVNTAGRPLALSRLALGSTYFGGEMDQARSFALLDRYYALGGRTLDTARSYSQTVLRGQEGAEGVIGRWIASRGVREQITLVTKGCHYPDQPVRVTPQGIREDAEDSLRCLGVERVDLYLLHRDDPAQPVGPLMEALNQLVESGKTRAVGASNWTTARIREANAYAAAHGLSPFAVSQIQWSLAAAGPAAYGGDSTLVFMDGDTHAAYREMGLPVMAFASQAKGLYSKYLAGGMDAITGNSRRFFSEENIAKAEVVRDIAQTRGISPTAVVLGYVVCDALPACAVIGPSSIAQLEDSMSAGDITLTAGELERLRRGN